MMGRYSRFLTRSVAIGILGAYLPILGSQAYAQDITPPELVSFTVSPLVVDTSTGTASVSVRIEARDDLSGFGGGTGTGNGSIDVRHTSGNPPVGRGSLPITGGTNLEPVFEFDLTFPQFSALGFYPINLTLIDNLFNTLRLSPADLAARGFPSQIEVALPPIPDHFLVYKTEASDDSPDFDERTVSLADQFETGHYEVEDVWGLANPADKNGEGITDPDTHLVIYEIERDYAPKHQPRALRIENQFGEFLIDTDSPVSLLVPSAKDLFGYVKPLEDPGIDHFKCYEAWPSAGEPAFSTQVLVVDQFDQPKLYDLQFDEDEPALLCNPVDKNGEGILNPDDHLFCYEVKRADDEPSHVEVTGIYINNQFGPLQLDTEEVRQLCVPSTKEVLGPVDDDDDDNWRHWRQR